MLSARGYRLCHLHRDPLRGWRGRSSEDKFSTLEQTNLRSPRATPLPPNQLQSCSPPPIHAEQWGGTKGKDQARLMRAPAAAVVLGSGERDVSAGAGREAIVFKLSWVPCSPVACLECRFPGTARQS